LKSAMRFTVAVGEAHYKNFTVFIYPLMRRYDLFFVCH